MIVIGKNVSKFTPVLLLHYASLCNNTCYKETQWLGVYRQSETRAGNHRHGNNTTAAPALRTPSYGEYFELHRDVLVNGTEAKQAPPY